MVGIIQTILPYGVLISHILLVALFLAVIFRRTWGAGVVLYMGRYSLVIGLIIAISAVIGSLFYSEIVGFPPCVLCWWQRVFLYPQAALFALAVWKKDSGVFLYSGTLAVLAGIVALYHSYVYWGGKSLLPCTALGGACDKIYVMEFGYITIPTMSLTIVLYLLLLAWINRIYYLNTSK
ncbi:MAG: disulfide bond formation protein B [Candidatus Zambryskibacteria bacterium]|nr:disulfide bond formation protein B [Candidatus Zambryskibacteria bacterium]